MMSVKIATEIKKKIPEGVDDYFLKTSHVLKIWYFDNKGTLQ